METEEFDTYEVHNEFVSFIKISVDELDRAIFGSKKSEIRNVKRVIIWNILVIFLAMPVESAIHECSHAIFAIMFGGYVERIEIFPITLFIHNAISSGGFIILYGDFTEFQYAIIWASGTLGALTVGCFLFLISFRRNYPPLFKMFCMWLFAISSVEFFAYPILDVLAYDGKFFWITDVQGDWYRIYSVYPNIRYVVIIMSIMWFVFVLLFFVKFSDKELGL